MGLRVFGLKMEKEYGEEVDWDNYIPDFHQEVDSADFKLNDDPTLTSGGSRSYKNARAGVMKPTGTVEGKVDLQRVGHYFRALLDQYVYTKDGDTNIHEFYGGEGKDLASFSAIQTYDLFQKQIVGLILDTLKIEVSDEYMTFSNDWIYKDESFDKIDASEYEKLEVKSAIPLMFYDVKAWLGDEVAKVLNGQTLDKENTIQNSFSMEVKNNLNVDKTIGLGSRRPQKKANAQLREIALSIVSILDYDTLDTIIAGEYGEVGAVTPTQCKLVKIPLLLDVNICEDATQKLQILFPECILKVEYDLSEVDDIEATISLTALGTGKAKLNDNTEVNTDIYIRLINSMPEITTEEVVPVTP